MVYRTFDAEAQIPSHTAKRGTAEVDVGVGVGLVPVFPITRANRDLSAR